LSIILRSLQRLLTLLEDKNIPYMIIGGYALPFYGRIRTTVDLDLAIAIETETEFGKLTEWLSSTSFKPTISSFLNPLLVVFDQIEKVEIELWMRPDGIVFNVETLKRRRKVKLGENVEAWIVSPEDFIVNKLARPDRGVNDEQDVKSVLVMQSGSLDEEYLQRRAQETGVLQVLRAIRALGS
jgi:predicted nucleotidyltransferase